LNELLSQNEEQVQYETDPNQLILFK